MMQQQYGRPAQRWLLLAGVMLVSVGLALPARAEEKAVGSLGLIPADAAYYSTMLRMKEQIDIVARSRAWKELWELPSLKQGWALLKEQYSEGNLATVRTFFEEAENQELLELLQDAGSHEIFSYAGANVAQFAQLMGLINHARLFGQITSAIEHKGEMDARDQFRAVLRAVAAHPELIQVPDSIVGFKITDKKRAQHQLRRLEIILTGLSNLVEPLKGHIKMAKVGEADFLTIDLDGEMVPWDQVPVGDLEEKEGEFQGLVKKLRATKLTLSLGVKGDYLLLALGASTDVLKQLGTSGQRLIERPEMKPVLDARNQRLVGISYSSPALRNLQTISGKDLEDWLPLARQGLQAAGLPPQQRKQIETHLRELARELVKDAPQYGAEVAFGYLTDRGSEAFTYDHSSGAGLDASQPLSLLGHVGGSPILALFARQKPSIEDYRTFVKWAKILYGDAEEVLVAHLNKEEQDHYQQAAKIFRPLLARLDEITATMLLPALAEGESAFVIDARWSSRRWQKEMASMPQAMPMIEMALVLGVSDADLLRKAAAAYRDVLNEAAAKVRALAPQGKGPEINFPPPQKKDAPQGELYSYPLPAEAGLDAQILPTAGLSQHVLVLAPSHAMAQRLLADTSLKTNGGPLAEKQPLGAAVYFNWPALVDAVLPWVEVSLTRGLAAADRAEAGGAAPELPEGVTKWVRTLARIEQVRTAARILKCFRGYSSATYNREGVWVTHGESIWQDLPGR